MFKLDFDDALVDSFAEKIADRAFEKLKDKLDSLTGLPPMLSKKQLKDVLQIGDTKASQLLNRSDFPVFKEAGTLVPTHLLLKWIEKNTKWVENNSKYFNRVV